MFNVTGWTVDAIDVRGPNVLKHDANRWKFHGAKFARQLQIWLSECGGGCGLRNQSERSKVNDQQKKTRAKKKIREKTKAYLTQECRMHLLNVQMQLIQRIEIGFRAINAIQYGIVAAIAGHSFRIIRMIWILVMGDIDVWRIFSFMQTTYTWRRSSWTRTTHTNEKCDAWEFLKCKFLAVCWRCNWCTTHSPIR